MEYSLLIVDDEKELAEYTSKYFTVSGIKSEYVSRIILQNFANDIKILPYSNCHRCGALI